MKIFKFGGSTTPGRLETLTEMGSCLGVRSSSAEEAIPKLGRQQLEHVHKKKIYEISLSIGEQGI